MSILSFPNRGPWGKSNWRGNASGYIYKSLYELLKPTHVVEVFSGSGTAGEVAKELNIPIVELDLHNGFDATSMSILEHVGHETDFCFGHPPYSQRIIRYSGHVWGDKEHPSDLSHIEDPDEFFDQLQQVLLNQREATRRGGIYGTLVGDTRKNGQYISMQAELIARMPQNELKSIMVKTQHNTVSGRTKNYGRMRFAPIEHEYVILWEKSGGKLHAALASVTLQNDRRVKGTWRSIVRQALINLGGSTKLQDLYAAVAKHAPQQNLTNNPNWQAKIRQVLQRYPTDFKNKERGTWALA
ncbi:MAG TPA: hypothetical protein VK054_03475 [Beutenbergiaceae bacterium]|nr:hypothetical protein [Beutenbergiaceae bacterium]